APGTKRSPSNCSSSLPRFSEVTFSCGMSFPRFDVRQTGRADELGGALRTRDGSAQARQYRLAQRRQRAEQPAGTGRRVPAAMDELVAGVAEPLDESASKIGGRSVSRGEQQRASGDVLDELRGELAAGAGMVVIDDRRRTKDEDAAFAAQAKAEIDVLVVHRVVVGEPTDGVQPIAAREHRSPADGGNDLLGNEAAVPVFLSAADVAALE